MQTCAAFLEVDVPEFDGAVLLVKRLSRREAETVATEAYDEATDTHDHERTEKAIFRMAVVTPRFTAAEVDELWRTAPQSAIEHILRCIVSINNGLMHSGTIEHGKTLGYFFGARRQPDRGKLLQFRPRDDKSRSDNWSQRATNRGKVPTFRPRDDTLPPAS